MCVASDLFYKLLIYHSARDYPNVVMGNPSESELGNPRPAPDRTTTFTDFLKGMNISGTLKSPESKKFGHLKNSHSESNALYMTTKPVSLQPHQQNSQRHTLQRSDSSPSISPMRATVRRNVKLSIDEYPRGKDELADVQIHDHTRNEYESSMSPQRGRAPPRTSEKELNDVSESGENNSQMPQKTPRRSRSPMKRMFGEGGWLSSAADPKDESSNRKKPGLVDKIKHKIEEIVRLEQHYLVTCTNCNLGT
jgi:hypothetical protein